MPLRPAGQDPARAAGEASSSRVGDTHSETVDIRVLAATNRDLEDEIKAGRFREDLYYRLNVVHLHLPPLRDRGDDIVVLARYMVGRYAPEYGGKVRGPHAQRHRRHQAPPLAGQHPRAREPHQEGGRAGRQGAARPRGSRPHARRAAGRSCRSPTPRRSSSASTSTRSSRSTTATAPRPRAIWASTRAPSSATSRRAKGARCSTTGPTPAAAREASERRARPERPCKFTAPLTAMSEPRRQAGGATARGRPFGGPLGRWHAPCCLPDCSSSLCSLQLHPCQPASSRSRRTFRTRRAHPTRSSTPILSDFMPQEGSLNFGRRSH